MTDEVQVEETEDDFEAAFNAIASGEDAIEDDSGRLVEDEPELEDASSQQDEETAEGTDSASEEPQEPQNDDPWASTPEQIRAQFERIKRERDELDHRLRSDAGRVSALQRKINELESARQKNPAQEFSVSLPEGFAEDYPDIAAAMQATARMVREQTLNEVKTQFQREIEPLKQATNNSHVDQQDRILQEKYGDWKSLVGSQDFYNWLSVQPEPVRSLVSSDQASDASYLIDSYQMYRGATQARQPAAEASSSIVEKRERQLQAAESVPSKRVAQKQTVADDFDSAFNYFAKKATR